MSVPTSDGKRFLESLILQAETILGKMIHKLHRTDISLEEMVPMINSVYAFVNLWQVPLQDIELDKEETGVPVDRLPDANCQQASPHQALRANINSDQHPGKMIKMVEYNPVFDFPEPSLKDYHVDDIGVGRIMRVQPLAHKFYMVKQSHQPTNSSSLLFSALAQSKGPLLTHLPPAGEVFGIIINGAIFRAVRNQPPRSIASMSREPIYLHLVDTGQIVLYNPSLKLRALSDYCRTFPAQAVLCKLVTVIGDSDCEDLSEYLRQNLYVDHQYIVVAVEDGILFLTLCQGPINVAPNVHLFGSSYYGGAPQQMTFTSDNYGHPNQLFHDYDYRLCPFSESDSTGCSQGAHRKKVSSEIDEISIERPADHSIIAGTELVLVPRIIESVERIFCTVDGGVSCCSDQLIRLEKVLNHPVTVMQYLELAECPRQSERVLVLSKTWNWCRAEVVRRLEEDKMYVVLLLDYGTEECVDLVNMRQLEARFSQIPYELKLCRIADLESCCDRNEKVLDAINQQLRGRRFSARVLNCDTPWEVKLYEDGYDVGERLVQSNLARLKPKAE